MQWAVTGSTRPFWARSQNCEKRLLASSCRYLCLSVCLSVHPSVLMEQLGSHWTDFDGTWYLSVFRKSVEKIQFLLKSEKNNGYFTRRMRNVLDKNCRENKSTHFISSNFFFPEYRAVCEIMSKNVVEPERPHMAALRHVACWVSQATRAQAHTSACPPTTTHTWTQTHAHTHTNMYVMFIAFFGNKVFVNVSQCHDIRRFEIEYLDSADAYGPTLSASDCTGTTTKCDGNYK